MKNLYTFVFLFTLLGTGSVLSQPLATRELSGQVKGQNTVPFVGFSLSVPLFKSYNRDKQIGKLLKLPKPPTSANARAAAPTEDGPIAWTYTGDEVIIHVPRSSGGSSGYSGGGGGNGGRNCGGCDQEQWDGGNNGGSVNDYSEEPPRALINARRVPKNYCQNGRTVFKNMWDRQNEVGKEQAAFITDKGIFWLNDSDNTATTYFTGPPPEYPIGPDGKRYFDVNGEIFTILGIVHTHPIGGLQGISGPDKENGNAFNVPNWAITDNGVFVVNPGQSPTVADYNSSDAFDCSLAGNLFSL